METTVSTRAIQLNRGLFAIVDECDYVLLSQSNWFSLLGPRTAYAYRNISVGTLKTTELMHRAIMCLEHNSPVDLDHRDGNGLNNSRSNIRICTAAQNCWNKSKRRQVTSSSYKGVTWHKQHKCWNARISVNHKRIELGLFDNEIDAARAYNAAATVRHGEFARMNIIHGDATPVLFLEKPAQSLLGTTVAVALLTEGVTQ